MSKLEKNLLNTLATAERDLIHIRKEIKHAEQFHPTNRYLMSSLITREAANVCVVRACKERLSQLPRIAPEQEDSEELPEELPDVSLRDALDEVADNYEGLIVLEPRKELDKCIVGVDSAVPCFVYSRNKILTMLVNVDEMSIEDAIEHFDFNIGSAYLGETSPHFLDEIELI